MADENLFRVQVVTPERVLLDGAASEVTLRTGEGDTTFLAGHTPLVGTIEPGVIRVVRGEGDQVLLAGHGGFVQVEQVGSDGPADSGDRTAPSARAAPSSPAAQSSPAADADAIGGTRVTLLVGVAELAEEIDTERAQTALEAAQVRVSELGGAGARSDEGEQPNVELAEAEAALRRAEVRLEVAADATAGPPGSPGSPGAGAGATVV
jgi:F0F1-type ATP synthase epsilon subunit